MKWMEKDLADRKARDLYRSRRSIESRQGVRVRLQGRTLVNFASNDYLNLATDPRLVRSAASAARRFGSGAGASPLIVGHLPPLRALERALARWHGAEGGLVFPSGYVANIALVSTLVERGDVIYSDALNHASLIDGSRLSRADVHIYPHGDVHYLDDLIRRSGNLARRRLIVTDSVFSMDGDFAPLEDLIELARRRRCLLLVDEAHATGVLGPSGAGLVESIALNTAMSSGEDGEFGVITMGTLSKALGSQGGFVVGSQLLINWLVNRARPYIFSTALAPPSARAAHRAVRIVIDEVERRVHLQLLGDSLRQQLRTLGFSPASSRCQIVPIILGDEETALRYSSSLEEMRLLVPAIRPPSVPPGSARLRISLSASHSFEDVARLVNALKAIRG